MKPEELALLRRYGQRKYHEAFQLRKSEREAEMQRLYVLDAVYQQALDHLDAPFYARAVAEQRQYENMERLRRSARQFVEAFEQVSKACIEVSRAMEEARSK